mmetsp:Transcript_70222/g.222650  ORF Transcript_70222/g.222650 Transcript_70222/m.222650 type:complete len:358 (+) Transcript_70222:203-1276(+)
MTLEEAPTCILRAARGDKIRINYTGRLKDGTVFEDTVKIGRPGEFTLGDGNLIEGWEEGIPGMCVGERRRLVIPHKMAYGAEGKPGSIPPKATLTFDLELLAVNGEAGEFAAAPSGPQTSSSEVGVGGTPPALGVLFCDACHTFVEEFFEGWIGHMEARRKQNDNIEASGQAPPSLTYDDESEDFVQNFCSGERIGNFKWAPHIKAGCEKIMANSKREIVGEWLSTEMDPRVMPEKKDKVCNVLNKACPPVPPAPKGECEQCLAAVEDVAFSFRRLRHGNPDSGSNSVHFWTHFWMLLHSVVSNIVVQRRDDVVSESCPSPAGEYMEYRGSTWSTGGVHGVPGEYMARGGSVSCTDV